MEEYYIYKINQTMIQFSWQYPKTIHYIARKKQVGFSLYQYQLIFQTHEEIDELLYEHFSGRKDYTYKNKVHYIRNEITGASSLVKIYPHCIYLKCSPKFYIMKNIILQSDSNYVILGK